MLCVSRAYVSIFSPDLTSAMERNTRSTAWYSRQSNQTMPEVSHARLLLIRIGPMHETLRASYSCLSNYTTHHAPCGEWTVSNTWGSDHICIVTYNESHNPVLNHTLILNGSKRTPLTYNGVFGVLSWFLSLWHNAGCTILAVCSCLFIFINDK